MNYLEVILLLIILVFIQKFHNITFWRQGKCFKNQSVFGSSIINQQSCDHWRKIKIVPGFVLVHHFQVQVGLDHCQFYGFTVEFLAILRASYCHFQVASQSDPVMLVPFPSHSLPCNCYWLQGLIRQAYKSVFKIPQDSSLASLLAFAPGTTVCSEFTFCDCGNRKLSQKRLCIFMFVLF